MIITYAHSRSKYINTDVLTQSALKNNLNYGASGVVKPFTPSINFSRRMSLRRMALFCSHFSSTILRIHSHLCFFFVTDGDVCTHIHT